LPFSVYEHRADPYDCVVDVCSIGDSGDLLLPLGTIEETVGSGPEVVRKEKGIYVRRPIPTSLAPLLGLLLPIGMVALATGSSLSVRGKKEKTAER
jgi:hypothetical protein